MTASFIVASLALTAALGSSQTPYVYPSQTATYAEGMVYVMCDDGPAPTPKHTRPSQQFVRQGIHQSQVANQSGTPFRLDPSKILPPKPKPPQTIRGTLYFEYNSSSLPQCDKLRLAELRQAAAAPGAKVTITGYTDKRGKKRYNDRLALLRANSVRKYLGLGKETAVIGKGKCCYLDESHGGKDRRVEVVIEREAQKVQKTVVVTQQPKQNLVPVIPLKDEKSEEGIDD
ncbi:MAG: OmpA family protein [Syntrophales bacterium]